MAELTTPIVFIVDDDVHLRQALGNLFASVGMRVELFGSTSALRARPAVEISSLCQATRSTRRENLIYRSSGDHCAPFARKGGSDGTDCNTAPDRSFFRK
ncbi:hypothetical protein FHS21_001856 [Phyllobacterium trifolii]|uniref:Uncharacterized protein n=1 Tax=Phyllobacterium trifolii TaxID=300193 RepID=A0A839U606_9HYPH|nr:hypothetical protein [Phyllobacterium trifolii]